jgi:hypothetical protein
MHCDQIEFRELFLFSYICWGFLCALRYDLFWRKLHGLLRRMYIVLGMVARDFNLNTKETEAGELQVQG